MGLNWQRDAAEMLFHFILISQRIFAWRVVDINALIRLLKLGKDTLPTSLPAASAHMFDLIRLMLLILTKNKLLAITILQNVMVGHCSTFFNTLPLVVLTCLFPSFSKPDRNACQTPTNQVQAWFAHRWTSVVCHRGSLDFYTKFVSRIESSQ